MDREQFLRDMHEYRGVNVPCKRCGGSGVRTYGSTSTWRGGIGGSAMTSDVCDGCWGSGDAAHKWTNLRKLERKRMDWEAEQCAKWLADRAGISLRATEDGWKHLVSVIEKEARRRKPPEGANPFWYARTAETLAAVLRELLNLPSG